VSHRVQIKFTRTQATAALEALAMTIADDPDDEEAKAAHRKLQHALARREEGLAARRT
jgi:hypothetical protein